MVVVAPSGMPLVASVDYFGPDLGCFLLPTSSLSQSESGNVLSRMAKK